MLFALYCRDKTDALQIRMDNRPNHLEFLNELGDRVKLAGPLVDHAGKDMIGSIIVLEADSLTHAREIAAQDPYSKAGLFESVSINEWKWVIGNPDT